MDNPTKSSVCCPIWNNSGSWLHPTGNTTTYTLGGWNGWMHHVKINSLKGGTKYFYRVGDGASSWSKTFFFSTEPLTNDRILTIANIGDMGTVNSAGNQKQLQRLVASGNIDFIIHNGDISYADGFQSKWDIFFRQMENITAFVPYMATPGNHEVGVIGLLGWPLGYVNRFILPGADSISSDLENLYYSWNYGKVHFLAIDTESVLDVALITEKQVAWIESDLNAVDRKKTPWIVVFGHRPMYCSNQDPDCFTEADVLKTAVEDLFNVYKVDLVLMAHKHNYERFYPTNSAGIWVPTYDNPPAPVYVLNGAGGNREGVDHVKKWRNNTATFISSWGYGLLRVYNETVLDWEFHDADTNNLLDSFTLKVNH